MAETTTKTTLPKNVFDVKVENHELLKRAYDAYLANGRRAHAKVLERGDVRGGGKKPWKQKGTGRARFGSTRNPIWRGGGIVFGPTGTENYTKKLPTATKRVAVRQALTLANKAKKITVDEVKTTGKTSEVAAYLVKNKLNRKTLVVVDEKTPALVRATQNIPTIALVRATYLNVYHILNADHIVIAPSAVKTIETWLAPAAKTEKGDK